MNITTVNPNLSALSLAMLAFVIPAVVAGLPVIAKGQDMAHGADNFYRSDKVTLRKATFKNQYKMDIVGNLYIPNDTKQGETLPAIVVGHPMGAVKEQSANLYAVKMAERGYVTLAIDLSFWGESDGKPRNMVSPEIYSDDFSAAVDFLSDQTYVDSSKIGVIGICGSGSFAISAAKIDPRLKAVATVSMYDMGAAARDGLRKSQSLEARQKLIDAAIQQRFAEFKGAPSQFVGGTVLELTPETDPVQREFFDFYRTPRGEFTPKEGSPECTTKPTLSSLVKFLNFYPFNDIETISPRPMLFITGENAHSREFSEDAYKRASEPKELLMIPGAGHVDLYDRVDLIPWDSLQSFFDSTLK